jgi:hypothetical protein
MSDVWKARIIGWGQVFGALSVMLTFGSLVIGFIAMVVFRVYGAQIIAASGLATAADVARVEMSIADATVKVAELRRQIVVLSRPDDVVIYLEDPRPVDGFCQVDSLCAIQIYAERDPRAEACQIIQGSTEMIIYSGGREYVAQGSTARPARNLPATPRTFEPSFEIPASIPPGPARARIRTAYTDCPWQINGDPPVTMESPSFALEIVE